jgi:hypothetical protein
MRNSPEKYRSPDSEKEDWLVLENPIRQSELFPGRRQEKRFFTFFSQHLAPSLGGYFDTEFWSIQLPRVAHSEPAVYHAIIAIAVLNQDHINVLRSEQEVPFLLHYNKAIHFVKTRLQEGGNSQHVILLTCLLFICLEFKRGNTDVALNHLQSGLGILHSQEPNHEPSELSDISESLAHAFSRLGIQGSLVGRQPPPGCHHTLKASNPGHIPFSSIGEARNALIFLFIESLRPFTPKFSFEASFSTSFSEQARRATLISQLHQWNSKLGLFMTDTLSSPTPQDMRMIRLLRIQSLVAIIWNSTTIPSSDGSSIEPAFDGYVNMFETIISLAAFFINDRSTQNSRSDTSSSSAYSTFSSNTYALAPPIATTTSRSKTSFSFEMGLIFALYFVAIKCRSPTLRRQATYFLSLVEPRREGMWDANVLEKISQYVIEVEERDCMERVTEDVQTWPRDECRVNGMYIFPRCDYEARVQRVKFFWGPGGRRNSGLQDWVEDIRF